MKVKVKEGTQVENPRGGVFSAGDTMELADSEAEALIQRGLVEKVNLPKKASEPEKVDVPAQKVSAPSKPAQMVNPPSKKSK